jgi:actin-like ATPase involved in cell morphogenesis
MPIYKPGGQELETMKDNPELAPQQHVINDIEIINVNTKEITHLATDVARAIVANVDEILAEIPPPINVNEVYNY